MTVVIGLWITVFNYGYPPHSRTPSYDGWPRRRWRSSPPARLPSLVAATRPAGPPQQQPRYQVTRASPAMLAVGEAGCAPGGGAFWGRQGFRGERGHAGQDAALRAVREAARDDGDPRDLS